MADDAARAQQYEYKIVSSILSINFNSFKRLISLSEFQSCTQCR